MAIKFCPNCLGKPYTDNMSLSNCPNCSAKLQVEGVINSESLKMRQKLPDRAANTMPPLGGGNTVPPLGGGNTVPPLGGENTTQPFVLPQISDEQNIIPQEKRTKKSGVRREDTSDGQVCIVGVMTDYDCREVHRLLPTRIYHTLSYGQRFEDTLHSFTVTTTTPSGESDTVTVNVFGSLNTGGNLRNNSKVKVRGKFTHDNILMADRVWVVNGNYDTPVDFQHDVKMIGTVCIVGGILILLAMLLLPGIFSGGGIGSLTNALGGFLSTWLTLYVLLMVLYIASFFTRIGFLRIMFQRGRKRIPIPLLLLIVSFVLALLLHNVFGFGDLLRPLISSGLEWGITILLILAGIGMMLKALR